MSESSPINQIISDVLDAPIILVSKRGHGKSTSLMTIIDELKQNSPNIIVKTFDISQVWYHKAPVKYRQRVTVPLIQMNGIANIGDCVYEIGSLSKDVRRRFVAWIISQDYRLRYELGLRSGKEAIEILPKIIYILEEANTYFGSYSLRKNDDYTATLNDFISVGRNYGLSAFLVVTAEVGELSPSLRRRSTRLIGRIVNDYDMRMLNRKMKALGDAANRMPKYHWIYYNGEASKPFRIRDEVKTVPTDFKVYGEKENGKISKSAELSTATKYGIVVLITFLVSIILFHVFFK